MRTERTTPTRHADRVSHDRDLAYAVLDEAAVCHLGYLAGGAPRVLPTLFARLGDTLYLHGSTGSGPMLSAREPATICVTVTVHDGWVLARSQTNHSANYRCVVAYGTPRLVTDRAEKVAALAAVVDRVAPGRAADTRPPDDKELARTAVLALPLTELSVKVRTGGPVDEEADYALPVWAGVVPLRVAAGVPQPDPRTVLAAPEYLRVPAAPWLAPVVLRGEHVVLEPLDMSHVDGLLAALDDAEVWRHIPRPRPTDRAGMAALVAEMLEAQAIGVRTPFVQRAAGTGEVIGTTSYMWPERTPHRVEIGGTQLGRAWWRTGANTEAKLLLLGRAFDGLGVVRVEWQTDIRNERSQAAIARLGATREGVLHANRPRADGTWRDSVLYALTAEEWPPARELLRARLRPAAQSGAARL
ncbi:MAG TPA: bifunctional pyridoxamine 5'-phosphate oxidase family protein/GNAT family N-acetyltransferase [Rugosimonospora sp.]|nr:bifunctional pyridoxamine 5'-phosphate oxidase family protein/GNAT family N-acetyltransferase [Rugosimonospora sp.]